MASDLSLTEADGAAVVKDGARGPAETSARALHDTVSLELAQGPPAVARPAAARPGALRRTPFTARSGTSRRLASSASSACANAVVAVNAPGLMLAAMSTRDLLADEAQSPGSGASTSTDAEPPSAARDAAPALSTRGVLAGDAHGADLTNQRRRRAAPKQQQQHMTEGSNSSTTPTQSC